MKNPKIDEGATSLDVSTNHEPSKTCFVIMPISDHVDYAPGHFRRVYEYIIIPACKKAGFKAKRADDVRITNVIMIDILESILNSEMAICDLSSRNPNVLYELGIRQAFDMPVTIIKDDVTADIFDVNTVRYLKYDFYLRIDLVNDAIDSLSEAIKDTYEKKNETISSLVQLLGRKKAVVKPSELSPEGLVLLDAINQLYGQIKPAEPLSVSVSNSTFSDYIDLNGLILRIGDRVRSGPNGIGVVTKLSNNGMRGGYGVTVQYADQRVYYNEMASGNLTKLDEGQN